MLIVALLLSALNAIMGCARSLHQMSVDGQFPRFFQRINQHGVPARAMGFNVVCSLVVVLLGGAVEIYTFSNVGYTGSFLTVLVGYYLLRKHRPNVTRPFRLPEFFKYIALAMAALYAFIWLYGGISYARHRRHRDLLLPRLGRRARVHPVLPVPDARRGQAAGVEPEEPDPLMTQGAVPSK